LRGTPLTSADSNNKDNFLSEFEIGAYKHSFTPSWTREDCILFKKQKEMNK